MRPDPRVAKLARLLVEYSTEVKERDAVIIQGSIAAEPLLREIYREVLCQGAHPHLRIELEDQGYLFFSHAEGHQIDYQSPFELYETEHADVVIKTFPDLNPHALTSIDPDKKRRRISARRPVIDAFTRRWGKGELRWVGTACPTTALAQEAHMSLDEFSEFVFACGRLNDDDPIAYWRDFSARQQGICDRLNQVSRVRYVGLDTDLSFSCQGRTWMNCDGKVNFPDGEVFTGPVEDSVEGTVRFTYPGIFEGQEVEDIFLRFEGGKVVEARAAKGEALLHQLLDTDEGSRHAGEIAIGTNTNITRFTKSMLFDEKMGGTVHLAIGRSIPQTGGRNESAIHWDMLKDMREGGEIYADGTLIYQNGRFLNL